MANPHLWKPPFLWRPVPHATKIHQTETVAVPERRRQLSSWPLSPWWFRVISGFPWLYKVVPPRKLSWFITPITMVYRWYIELVNGLINQLRTGGHHLVCHIIIAGFSAFSPEMPHLKRGVLRPPRHGEGLRFLRHDGGSVHRVAGQQGASA